MNAVGKGLEIDVALSSEEINVLAKADLIGKARIYNHIECLKTPGFVLSTFIEEQYLREAYLQGCIVRTEGDAYIPDSKRVFFFLTGWVYDSLTRNGYCVSRFSTGGKIKIFDTQRKEEVYR